MQSIGSKAQRRQAVNARTATNIEKAQAGQAGEPKQRDEAPLRFGDPLLAQRRREACPVLTELKAQLGPLFARPGWIHGARCAKAVRSTSRPYAVSTSSVETSLTSREGG